MKAFLTSAVLLLCGIAWGDDSTELNSGEPRRVSFEEAQRLLGEVPSITFEEANDKSSLVRIPDVKLDEVCLSFKGASPATLETVFEFHALHLTDRKRPDLMVTVHGCTVRKGALLATLFSFDGSKYRPTWVQPARYDYNSVGDIRDLDQDGFEEMLFLSHNSSVYSFAPLLLWGRDGKVVSENLNGLPELLKKGKTHWLALEKRAMDAGKEDQIHCFRWRGAKAGLAKSACPR